METVTFPPPCPRCGGEMWNNSTSKRNPKAPDAKCKDKENCDGAVWLKDAKGKAKPNGAAPKEDARHYLMRSANLLKLAHAAAKAVIGDEYQGEDARTLFIDAQRNGYVGTMSDKPLPKKPAPVDPPVTEDYPGEPESRPEEDEGLDL